MFGFGVSFVGFTGRCRKTRGEEIQIWRLSLDLWWCHQQVASDPGSILHAYVASVRKKHLRRGILPVKALAEILKKETQPRRIG